MKKKKQKQKAEGRRHRHTLIRPSFNSSRRNCQLSKPDDVSSALRNSRKSSGDTVSRIANCSSSSYAYSHSTIECGRGHGIREG